MGQRLTGMTSRQDRFPVAASRFSFARHGQSGATISDLLPFTAKVADELCFIKTMHTEAINHDPAVTFFQTGAQLAGRPSIGAWVSYGLGSENQDLPAFVVMISRGSGNPNDQPLYDRLWGSGFLPTTYQGIKFRSVGDPVLYLNNPAWSFRRGPAPHARRPGKARRAQSSRIRRPGDPHAHQAIRDGVPDANLGPRADRPLGVSPTESSTCTAPTHARPGPSPPTACWRAGLPNGVFASSSSSIAAGTSMSHLPARIAGQCRDTDQASAALVMDLKERGLLDDTLVIWGGEFGRTVYCQGPLTAQDYGRDHHPRCFTIWLCGGGIKPGITHGATDDFGYNIARDPVHVHDLQATILHCLGIDHTKLTFQYQGRHHRLTDVHGTVVKQVLS